ncbi:hypothetical protein Elgi_04700 [Paenibacillus elgii]|uniref:cellulase family glycosylhydrolase n=1 Tax=Paenibacillus elgii TaxID=189691 RepID=UPI002D7B7DD7|nr:hypothetical protein Elgi_04700 [Paenibacillus elgii]
MKKSVVVLIVCLVLLYSFPIPQARAMDAEYFGVNEHPHRYADYPALIDQMAASQVKWIRISPEWGALEPAKGKYDPNVLAKMDDIVKRLTDKGINIVWILAYTAPWASSKPGDPESTRYKPANWADWENYVKFITARYKGVIHHWEVWNEPDYSIFWKSGASDYLTLLQKAYNQIKATDPTNQVLMGGLALAYGRDANYGVGAWFDQLMDLGAGNYFDVINYHAYGPSQELVKKYNGMMEIVRKHSSSLSGKPVWITETGLTSEGMKLYEQANYVDQVYVKNKRWPNIAKVFWYNYRNANVGDVTEDNYGLVKQDLTPLKAFYHYQALNGAETFFGTEMSQALTLSLNTSPGDSGVKNYGSHIEIDSGKYAYFRVNDEWLRNANEGLDPTVQVEVTYRDSGSGSWFLQYDGQKGPYTQTAQVVLGNTGEWKTQSFTLDDAKFDNRQNVSSDFRIWSRSGVIHIGKVKVKKQSNRAKVILKEKNLYTQMVQIQSDDPKQETYSEVETVGGLEARKVIADNKYLYFQVSDGFVREGDTQLTIKVSYFDARKDKILLQYNAIDHAYKGLEIQKEGTGTWKEAVFKVTDAKFTHRQNYYGDLRIGNNYDNSVEHIRSVEIIK